jgi:hypothetical protein
MQNQLTRAVAFSLLAAGGLHADFTYEETSKITGGAIVSLMKFAGAFSKDARRATDPTVSTVAIKGNRMVRKSQLTATITDLDAETITIINFEKKTYSTMTFAQMKQAMDDAMKQMNQAKANAAPNAAPNGTPDAANVKFDVKVQDTGQTRPINGITAREMILTMTMEGTDQQSGAKGGMNIITDSWLAPRIPGYEEVREFYRRMAEKVNWVPSSTGMLNRPDISRGMSELYKEGSKLEGIPVLQTVKMGGTVEGAPQSQTGGGSGQTTSSSSSSSSQAQAPPTSLGGALGSALGGRFGLGRKKKDDSQNQPADSSSGQSSGSASLMEMTIELTSYSSAPADGGLFVIPAGFKQVEAETNPGRRAR